MRERLVKANKKHICSQCTKPIAKGTMYLSSIELPTRRANSFKNDRWCLICAIKIQKKRIAHASNWIRNLQALLPAKKQVLVPHKVDKKDTKPIFEPDPKNHDRMLVPICEPVNTISLKDLVAYTFTVPIKTAVRKYKHQY